MVLKPIGHNAQVQRLTTALKNICRDYPAGGTVLRELLQNADDAGATEVRFVLDDRTYNTNGLIHSKLGQYQGPALLAYNNAIFRDQDFESLSRLGDSLKLDDGSTTGRFGRGFNSVYNWTDSPSIVSRERLLILDPHCEWSKGGPVYDFVENANIPAIKNHMDAFKSVMVHTDKKLVGTVIRIPLRTREQALKSEISKMETTVKTIQDVLQIFASDFGDNGLLFMRNVESLEIDSTGLSIGIAMADRELLRAHKMRINDAIKESLKNQRYSFDYSFRASVQYRSRSQEKTTDFAIHHSFQNNSMDTILQTWADDQKLIPWVAVAAQLPIQPSEKVEGSLFTVLPLPITTTQPIHIHALFSLSPDRAMLHLSKDKSTQDQNPAKWNNWLLQEATPLAWVRLLAFLAQLQHDQSAFERWPQVIDDHRDPLSKALEKAIKTIQRESLAIWPTGLSSVGYVTTEGGFLASGSESAAFRYALYEATVPVVYVPKQIYQHVQPLFKDRALSPQTLCYFMNSNRHDIANQNSKTKNNLLEYILSDPAVTDYGDLEIFPFEDGIYRSINNGTAFVHRDKSEKALFHQDAGRNLSLDCLSETTKRALRKGCENGSLHPSIRYRSAKSLNDYCKNTIFKHVSEDQDSTKLGERGASFVSQVWSWISERKISILDKNISGLWLLPLSNGHHRKIVPKYPCSIAYSAPAGKGGDLMRRLDAKLRIKPLPLLCTGADAIGHQARAVVKSIHDMKSAVAVVNAKDIVGYVQWLHQTLSVIDVLEDDDRMKMAQIIASQLSAALGSKDCQTTSEAVRDLPIFQKVTWNERDDRMDITSTWTKLSASDQSIGLLDESMPVPAIPGLQFLNAAMSSHAKKILETLNLARCLGAKDVIQDHIIPAWKNGQDRSWSPSCKEQMAVFILEQFTSLSLECRSELHSIAIIPVMKLSGEATMKFARAVDLIDPSEAKLTNLCFDDEEVTPSKEFLHKFHVALIGCGLKTSIDEEFVDRRVQCYASGKYPLKDLQRRAHLLLQSSCDWTSPSQGLSDSNLRRLAWLPVTDASLSISLKTSLECRGPADKLLVGSQLPIVDIYISHAWESSLGWDSPIDNQILLSQLKFGIEQKSQQVVDAVLKYISRHALVEVMADKLMSLRCVFVNSDLFVEPSIAFRPPQLGSPGCHRLQPYLANVDHKFWQDHKDLLIRLCVSDKLSQADLLKVQQKLESKELLEELDVGVAIEVLNLASKFPRETLAGFKVLGASGKFFSFEDINYGGDLEHVQSREKVNLTHPDIPRHTITRLGIDSLRDRLMKGLLEINDVEDEDEFDQQENAITRIADTLERYPVETTFREYLANADDTKGASRIIWLLDERQHPVDDLITPEMKDLQGPAFLVHNDGVFSDSDFNGFKNVGEGSKMHDPDSIGQFGRGSQTMFHFTSVPMILSGDYLLILDPQQEVLPLNLLKGKRKPGLKLKLSKLRLAMPNQLVPFEDLFGYTLDLDHYPGTIFRFPLRTPLKNATLGLIKKIFTSDEVSCLMDTYFDEARVSLLFLRRIKSIEFQIHGKPDCGWSIYKDAPQTEFVKPFSDFIEYSFRKYGVFGDEISGNDEWWVSIENSSASMTPGLLPTSSRRVAKKIEWGLAALMASTYNNDGADFTSPKPTEPRMFSTLPLSISADLPVHVHATFSLSGDRKSIALDECVSKSHGSESNRYLLQEAIPKLYLSFLADLVMHIPERIYDFWPQEEPPKKSFGSQIYSAFWKDLPSSSLQLFKKAQSTINATQGRPVEILDFNHAVFDFLFEYQSTKLMPLLLSLGVDLIRDIPKSITDRLKLLPDVKHVTGSMLRGLLKSGRSRAALLKAMESDSDFWETLIRFIAPANLSATNIQDLDGCHILPLADGSLGTLRLLAEKEHTDDQNKPNMYYAVSKEQLQLFDFASMQLVESNIALKLEPYLSRGKERFNVETLNLSLVEKLLQLRPAVAVPNERTDTWLVNFWKYWNSHGASFKYPDLECFTASLFRATCNGVDHYITPRQFYRLPAVVEPATPEHRQLCQQCPGIYLVDPKLMPKSLATMEKSLSNEQSFSRFVRAVVSLRGKPGLEGYVLTHVDSASMKILQGLAVQHVYSFQIFIKDPSLRAPLKSLPLWPTCSKLAAENLTSAANGLIAADDTLLAPWMKDCNRFIDPAFLSGGHHLQCLLSLGVQQIMPETLLRDHVLPLPQNILSADWQRYQALIVAITVTLPRLGFNIRCTLSRNSLVADGNRTLRRASDLYDHKVDIFQSAFRNEVRTRFVHDELKDCRDLWLVLDIRQQLEGFINPDHYIQCLQVMALRAGQGQNDPHFEQDCKVVLAPLTTASPHISRFGEAHWLAISRQRVFRPRTGFNGEPDYRRNNMAMVAIGHGTLCLSEVISKDYISVCWSQTSFAPHEPTKEVLEKIPSKGKPTAAMVWRHLLHLKAISQRLKGHQVEDFLDDLQKTYQYLQDCLEESRAAFNLENNAVWLNLSSWNHHSILLEDVKNSWHGIKQLVLSSSCDSGRVKAVRPGLMVYDKLLRILNCSSITYPTVTLPPLHEGYSLGTALCKLRKEGKMLDIAYSSQGRSLQAHRMVLAAASAKCAAQFSGSWALPIGNTITYDEQGDPNEFLTYRTLTVMIDHAYEEPIDWSDMEVSESDDDGQKATKLETLLNLCKGADQWIMPSLKSQAEVRMLAAGRMFINLENCIEVMERSALAGAATFERMCADFIKQNQAAVERAHSEGQD